MDFFLPRNGFVVAVWLLACWLMSLYDCLFGFVWICLVDFGYVDFALFCFACFVACASPKSALVVFWWIKIEDSSTEAKQPR